ncbi:hypothetical protein VHEMI04604 [[Torrubiella] hemipterigena]|uniref:non-specific serine/threonine protein kinase n=1 Tax=[Torrubiella] hemipterigena TaxID=1531966 RepID=A0A0A1TGS0_9HYPO|nr:hypothetical protein VHEMI04604 [[Torrubiella] hemipterigena]
MASSQATQKTSEEQQQQQQQDTAAPAARDPTTPAVRFASATQEILPTATTIAPPQVTTTDHVSDTFNEVTADQIKAFSKSLHGLPLQERRLNTFQFEAFSLPPSRVPSHDESGESSRLHTPISSALHSPHGSPLIPPLASPPLTPSASIGDRRVGRPTTSGHDSLITPQPSSSTDATTVTAGERRPLAHRPVSAEHVLRRASSVEEHLGGGAQQHRRGMYGAGATSVPVSRESSPSRSSASHFYSKPMTPVGDINDPYAKGRRPAQQTTNRHSIDPRFVFSRKKKHGSPHGSRSSLSGSGAFSGHGANKSGDESDSHHSHGSMADLKRFFRKTGHHGHKKHESTSMAPPPARPQPAPQQHTGTKTPPASRSSHQVPFADDHGLTSKYGKLGKVLGAGAGGSVRLMKRKEDNTVFAVKEFRARHTYETEREYNKKVTAEFCVGSTLHHGNIIETLDILQEKGRWFEVMEYAPYDLFAIVMTGKMSREEVSCCFLQILNGVTYLHSLGLAHRDLKLDNVVVSDRGIMKIIDFGSAHVFKYPFETLPVPAKGIVGSDPYLAPEVYESKEYDAASVDIWSLAIIFCCMTLRRFPWKIPRMTDNSYKLFASDPTPGHDPKKMLVMSKSTGDLANTRSRDFMPQEPKPVEKPKEEEHKHHHDDKHKHDDKHHHKNGDATTKDAAATSQQPAEKKEIIRGPWRILRLLPRESRHIIHRMLDLNPKTRAKMDEILQEPWVADSIICQQLENGEVLSAENHTHILEPPNNPSS